VIHDSKTLPVKKESELALSVAEMRMVGGCAM